MNIKNIKPNRTFTRSAQEGFVVMMSVILSIIILSITMGVLSVSLKEVNFSSSAVHTGEAIFAADVGIECALHHDKVAINAFPTVDQNININCGGNSINPSFTGGGSTATYNFKVPNLGNSNQSCADVTITKDNSDPLNPITRITSKGYNIGNSSCISSSTRRVERELIATFGNSGGGGSQANDTFTQASNVNLASHVPTGPNAGTGWVVQVAGGNITNLSTGVITDSSAFNGNRYKMNNDLGSDEMDIQADFTSSGTPGSFVFFGLIGRLPSGTGSSAIEGYYDHGLNQWILEDGTISASLNEAWPGGTVTMKLEVRSGTARLYANGILKVTLNTNKFAGQNYGGIFLGNFSGTAGRITADNYQSSGF